MSDSGNVSSDSDRYVVLCEECGKVSFDVLEHDWFGNSGAATWYAGYHGGKEHPDAERQFGYVGRAENTDTEPNEGEDDG